MTLKVFCARLLLWQIKRNLKNAFVLLKWYPFGNVLIK